MLLDVHILVMDYTPREYVRQCLDSVLVAIANAPYPIALHIVPGVEGSVGAGRTRGYSQGAAKYATLVDDDDWVAPDAFAILHPHLQADVQGVTTGEVWVDGGNFTLKPDSRHHLLVVKRDRLPDVSAIKFVPDLPTLWAVPNAVHIPQCVYYYRLWASGSRRQRRQAGIEAVKAEVGRIYQERGA